jgi:hypothetical protein
MWWVIADMKAGGQNATVGSDPVYLPCIGYILDELYTGGYMAVVDASKFFHQFSTHPADRPFLGVVQPISSTLLQWASHGSSKLSKPWWQVWTGFPALVMLRSPTPFWHFRSC